MLKLEKSKRDKPFWVPKNGENTRWYGSAVGLEVAYKWLYHAAWQFLCSGTVATDVIPSTDMMVDTHKC